MTPEQRAYAQSIIDGAPMKRDAVVAFLKAALASPSTEGLPPLAFEIERTDTGIHVPREANRSYSRREAATLLAMIAKALE